MSESPARQKVNELFPELLDGLRLLEGRFPANEIAARVVRAAMGQPGVVGARLWRADRGEAEVWAEAGTLPASAAAGMKPGLPSDTSKDPTIWAGALGSDDFRVRVLEVRGAGRRSRTASAARWICWRALPPWSWRWRSAAAL